MQLNLFHSGNEIVSENVANLNAKQSEGKEKTMHHQIKNCIKMNAGCFSCCLSLRHAKSTCSNARNPHLKWDESGKKSVVFFLSHKMNGNSYGISFHFNIYNLYINFSENFYNFENDSQRSFPFGTFRMQKKSWNEKAEISSNTKQNDEKTHNYRKLFLSFVDCRTACAMCSCIRLRLNFVCQTTYYSSIYMYWKLKILKTTNVYRVPCTITFNIFPSKKDSFLCLPKWNLIPIQSILSFCLFSLSFLKFVFLHGLLFMIVPFFDPSSRKYILQHGDGNKIMKFKYRIQILTSYYYYEKLMFFCPPKLKRELEKVFTFYCFYFALIDMANTLLCCYLKKKFMKNYNLFFIDTESWLPILVL